MTEAERQLRDAELLKYKGGLWRIWHDQQLELIEKEKRKLKFGKPKREGLFELIPVVSNGKLIGRLKHRYRK